MKKLSLVIILIVYNFLVFALEPYQENYFIDTYSSGNSIDASEDRQSREAVFKISLKQEINDFLFFFFTQKSFWQIHNEEHSRYFREHNYNPGFAVKFGGVQVGWEHESNGEVEPESRSYNRVFGVLGVNAESFQAHLKVWSYYNEEQGDNDNGKNTTRDETTSEMYGNGEVYLKIGRESYFSLLARSRYVEGIINVNTGELGVLFFYSNGYGDSLIDYNHKVTRVGLGISITD